MTKFTKQTLIKDGIYAVYVTPTGERKFVARFKRGGGLPSFITCLIKHSSVEEYFNRYNDGKGESPLDIAKSYGYLLPHIKTWLKRDGYPVTTAGYEAWSAAQHALWTAKMGQINAARQVA